MKKSIVLLVLFTMLVCLFNGAITRAYDVDHKTFENYNFMVAKSTTVLELVLTFLFFCDKLLDIEDIDLTSLPP